MKTETRGVSSQRVRPLHVGHIWDHGHRYCSHWTLYWTGECVCVCIDGILVCMVSVSDNNVQCTYTTRVYVMMHLIGVRVCARYIELSFLVS